MQQYRPQGFKGPGDRHLVQISRGLLQVLREAQKGFSFDTLRLRKTELAQLADILVEFTEDLHNGIGLWAAYERYNMEFFGVPLPFAPTGQPVSGIHLDRIRHLLWVLYQEMLPGYLLAPLHQDLERMSRAAHQYLNDAFQAVPRGSGIQAFLETPNQYGWDVKRKLVWMAYGSYLFRLFLHRYLDDCNRGRWDVQHVDDFICQECTCWSGLGVIDIMAKVLNISAKDQRELRSWYERHAAFYRILAVRNGWLEAQNLISQQHYQIHADDKAVHFKSGQTVFGSLVPWRGQWYWSGEQEAWDASTSFDLPTLRDKMKRQSSSVLCRYWKEYETQVRERAAELHQAALEFYGQDLIVYADGLSMARDWQRELQRHWDSKPKEMVEEAARKHGLKRGRPDISIPTELVNHDNGIAAFLNPQEGKEVIQDYNLIVAGLNRKGVDLPEDEAAAIRGFIQSSELSPAFVRRVIADHGDASIKAAFLLEEDAPGYWLDYLLRRWKGHFYRKRYPAMSVV